MINKLIRTSCPIIFKARKGIIEIHVPRHGLCNDVRKVTSAVATEAVAAWLRENLKRLPAGTALYVVTASDILPLAKRT